MCQTTGGAILNTRKQTNTRSVTNYDERNFHRAVPSRLVPVGSLICLRNYDLPLCVSQGM
jgi:hypothetical protein